MKNYTVTAIQMESGNTVHITGRWKDVDAMEETLIEDGFVVIWYTED